MIKYNRRSVYSRIWRYRYLYLFISPTLLYFFIFSYLPFYGLQLAFKDFKVFAGIWESNWVGFRHFHEIFSSPSFPRLLRNTLTISIYRVVFSFPVPIIFALLLNEVKHFFFKRSIQTVTYFPHFLSWVIYGGIVIDFIGPTGTITTLLNKLGFHLNIMNNPDLFRPMLVATATLKEFGWGAIIYLAAISSIDPHLYDAAKVDGARKLKQIWHVTLPGIRPTIVLLLILHMGHILDAGFEQVFMLYNGAVLDVADIIDTYVYRVGLLDAKYEIATAVGLFKGVVGAVLIVTANYFIRRLGEKSLW